MGLYHRDLIQGAGAGHGKGQEEMAGRREELNRQARPAAARLEPFRCDRNRSSLLSLTAADPRVRACAGAPDGRRAPVAAEERVQTNWNRSSHLKAG